MLSDREGSGGGKQSQETESFLFELRSRFKGSRFNGVCHVCVFLGLSGEAIRHRSSGCERVAEGVAEFRVNPAGRAGQHGAGGGSRQ